MDLYPAIDLRGGRCVRLYQGDYDRETVFSDDPVAQASAFAEAGAQWIHIVDLDGARDGRPAHREVIAAIAAEIDVALQVGGGIRDEAAVESLVDAGAARVVLGTVAVEQPAVVEDLAARWPVAVGLDARDGDLAVRGWQEQSGRDVVGVARRYESVGVAALVVTDIARDGTGDGPDLAGLEALLAATATPIVASGGVASVGDLRALSALHVGPRRLAGVVVGRALYDGRLSTAEALAATQATD